MTPSKSRSAKPAKGGPRTIPPKNRRTEILLENVQGQLEVVAEGHQMLAERMDRLETNLETKMEEGFKDQDQKRNLATQALTKRIDQVAGEVREVDQRLTKKIDAVADEVRELRGEVREVRTDIREHTQPRLDEHEARITALEGKPAA